MKHDWRRDSAGEVTALGDDYPYAECRICGFIAEYSYRSRQSMSDTDDCPGVDLNVYIRLSIHHPGAATEDDDSAYIRHHVEIPLLTLLVDDGDFDPVVVALAKAVAGARQQWSDAVAEHHAAWVKAVNAP